MAKDPQKVFDFLDDLYFMYKNEYIKEKEYFRAYKEKHTGVKNDTYNKWDEDYYWTR